MRFVLIAVGSMGLVLGLVALSSGSRSTPSSDTMAGVALTVASAVSLAVGMATIDIIRAIREKRG